MIRIEKQGLRYYQFESLKNSGIFHGIFTRKGGSSSVPWESLNIGGTVGDDPDNVNSNLARILSVVGISSSQLAQVHQIHSAKVFLVESIQKVKNKADAMITKRPGVYLLMRFADCVPIFFFDPENFAIGIAHAGWKGTVQQIALNVVLRMKKEFNSDPNNIAACIGPSIGPDHYIVQEDVLNQIRVSYPKHWTELIRPSVDGVKLDLWKANEISLKKAGVRVVEQSMICTGCETNEWYSHRAELGKTGRFAAIIGIPL